MQLLLEKVVIGYTCKDYKRVYSRHGEFWLFKKRPKTKVEVVKVEIRIRGSI